MKSSKIIKKESMDLIAERPVNFFLPAFLCSMLLIIMTTTGNDTAFVSGLFKIVLNYDPLLFLITFVFSTGFCYFLMANRKCWHQKNMGSLESILTTLKDIGVWQTITSLIFIWLANLFLLSIGVCWVIAALAHGGRVFSFGYGLTLGLVIIINLLLFMFKYALIDQFVKPSSLSKKHRFYKISWLNKVYNAINVSASLMTNSDFLWQWFKLTVTSLLWSFFSLIFYNVPMLVVYPYIVLCYINLYYAGIEHLKAQNGHHEIEHLRFEGAKNVALEPKSTHPFKQLNDSLNDGSGVKALAKIRHYKYRIKHYFMGPTAEEEKKAEQILQADTKKNKSEINKKGLARLQKQKQARGQHRAKFNQATTNPKDSNKVMRKNNGKR